MKRIYSNLIKFSLAIGLFLYACQGQDKVFINAVTKSSNDTTSGHGKDGQLYYKELVLLAPTLLLTGWAISKDSAEGCVTRLDTVNNGKGKWLYSLCVPNGCQYKLRTPCDVNIELNSGSDFLFDPDDPSVWQLSGEAVIITGDQGAIVGMRGGHTIAIAGHSQVYINNYSDFYHYHHCPLLTLVATSGEARLLERHRKTDWGNALELDGDGKTHTYKFEPKYLLSWTKQKFYLDHVPVWKLLTSFSRWYNIQLNVPEEKLPHDSISWNSSYADPLAGQLDILNHKLGHNFFCIRNGEIEYQDTSSIQYKSK